jgi:RNA polymerase sigma factor (sigma-70 family)
MSEIAELVRQSIAGDADAFAELVDRHERAALAVAYGVLGNDAAASDVVQEAFIRAWQKLPELSEPAGFGAWLMRVVRNLSIDQHRRQKTRDAADIDDHAPADDQPPPVLRLVRDETSEQIDAALRSLDELTRACVMLRYYENMTSKEIAEVLQLTSGAVDMRLSRARAQLRSLLGEEFRDGAGRGERTAGGREAGVREVSEVVHASA